MAYLHGGESAGSWGAAFASLGLVMVLGALTVRLLSWRRPT